MFLKQIKIENIRSYIDETINFSKGSTLLSGDIGSGKSTILLAIEFALFGTSRPDLPAELLLRKGAAQGSVELLLELKGKEVMIKRGLKKEKDTIKQLSGHVIINNTKKELTPVELKAEMISLLGYPEELVNKNKNYIYRFTVYTPQEEMKFILQENAEIRLDVLRKVFNIDKYKTVRENLQLYLKGMRSEIARSKTRTEPLEEIKQQILEIQQEKLQVEDLIEEISPKLTLLQEKLKQQKDILEELEKEQKEFLELKQNQRTNLLLINEKDRVVNQLSQKQESLKEEISNLKVTETDLEKLKEELKDIEINKNDFLKRRTVLGEKLKTVQRDIAFLQEEIKLIIEGTSKIEEKEKLKETLSQEVTKKEYLQKKKTELNELLEKTSEVIIKNKTLLLQSKELQEKISSLKNCPTCLQIVTERHKQKINDGEEEKNLKAEKLLDNLNKKKEEILQQRETVEQELKELIVKENLLTKTELELLHLLEKKGQIEIKKETLKITVQENNQLMQQLKQLEKEDETEKLNKRYLHIQEAVNLLSKKRFLENNLLDLKRNVEERRKEISELKNRVQEIENKLLNKKDLASEIEVKEQKITETRQLEKELAIKLAQFQTQKSGLNKQKESIQKNVDKLNLEMSKLIRLRKVYHWLEAHFLKLTSAIEKQVMINIHYRFNQMFQEWFSILIDDENIYSRIDDSFTPIIEQNGYEVSFVNLSGGEKTSASLAYRLALNQVVNDVISEINTKGLLILDEPTDGFSTEQLDKVRDVLEKLSLQQTILVSHETKIESFVENIVRIRKDSHRSSIA
ncbi:MAG: SMC family ATPase [Nanoarchaeota archaeon]|nr:SMC family ATPase [Nanoarchaeota archaeon]MBU1644411.1 SMC family ATPase [Nanoarchaeota archaeon]MBU1977505.1 SMC family ATPase [Nanoarchaeota archaeon]